MKHKNIIIAIIIISFFSFFTRFFLFTHVPSSLYWEEVALGYDSYSILKTGKDHHGHSFPIVAFESFGDYKPSGYFYFLVPSIAFFGLTDFAVRFPSAFFGSLTPIVIYLIVLKLMPSDISFRKKQLQAFTSAIFTALIPWHIITSRVAFETNQALFLFAFGFLLFIIWMNNYKSKKSFMFSFLSMIFFAMSMYTYHSSRIIVPLFGLSLGLIHLKVLKKNIKNAIFTLLLLLILILPILKNINNPQVSHRFKETSAFATLEPIITSNQKISEMGNTQIARIIHHRYRYYSQIFLNNYLSHFNFQFLFIRGDTNLRHSTGNHGQIFLIFLPLLTLSCYYFLKQKDHYLIPIYVLLLISPIPAAITKAAPHALRTLPMIVPITILSSHGLINFLYKVNNKNMLVILSLVITIFISAEFICFYSYYIFHYPSYTATSWWQYGYKDLVKYIYANKNNYDQIMITRDNGRPAMYYWFYTQTDPKLVQKWEYKSPKDQSEFLQFENIYFGTEPTSENKQMIISQKFLPYRLIKQIYDINQIPVFNIYEKP